ncbi:hypothetical protein OKW96_16545 [Sphingobacterium sp. KU25419]|nr:hypothetical protein OKW96_16545 [Sphingobacterium sp. KU25419]
MPETYGGMENRSARANLLTYITNAEANLTGSTPNVKKDNYPHNSFIGINDAITKGKRTGATKNTAKGHHIAEMSQVLPDGSRYVYGLPAMNNMQKEVTFSVEEAKSNRGSGMVKFEADNESPSNSSGRENYFQATYTPAYAHSYLLTSVLSSDYADISGDGPSEDDLGTYTKFNYTLSDSDFRWIAPFQASENMDSAQYMPGFWSDPKDDKGQYIIGSKETWYLHSVETKISSRSFIPVRERTPSG